MRNKPPHVFTIGYTIIIVGGFQPGGGQSDRHRRFITIHWRAQLLYNKIYYYIVISAPTNNLSILNYILLNSPATTPLITPSNFISYTRAIFFITILFPAV